MQQIFLAALVAGLSLLAVHRQAWNEIGRKQNALIEATISYRRALQEIEEMKRSPGPGTALGDARAEIAEKQSRMLEVDEKALRKEVASMPPWQVPPMVRRLLEKRK